MPTRTRVAWPLLALAAFIALMGLVVGDVGPLDRADAALSDQFRSYGTANADVIRVTRVVTNVMGTYAFLAIGLAATALLARLGRRVAAFCVAVTITVPVLWSVMHAVLHRPRPADGFVGIDSNGFPSGHTSHATAVALVAVLLLWHRLSTVKRVLAVTLAVAFAVGIGLTRVALLAHWPTDVLGGWLLGLAVVPLLARGFAGDQRPSS